MTASSLLFSFLNFKQGYTRGLGKAPHKPIMMLSVIEAIEKGFIKENVIAISPELVSLFKSYWDKLVKTDHTSNFALPFYHLSNEHSKTWELITKPGFENALTRSRSIKSFKTLNDFVYFAKLNNQFYSFLINKEERRLARNFILKKYFNIDSFELKDTYLNKYENEIINENPALYAAKIQQKTIEAKEEYVEEVYIRRGAFKRTIPKVYNNTCAITGLSISAEFNVSMIDACHIVPFSESHDDTIGNGIALCPNMHRAFDRGLISIDENYQVLMSGRFIEDSSPYSIAQFDKKQILLPEQERLYPQQENLDVHRKKFGFI